MLRSLAGGLGICLMFVRLLFRVVYLCNSVNLSNLVSSSILTCIYTYTGTV